MKRQFFLSLFGKNSHGRKKEIRLCEENSFENEGNEVTANNRRGSRKCRRVVPPDCLRRDRCMVSLNFVPLSGFFEDRPFATTHRPSPVPGLVQFLNGRLCRFFRSARLVDRPGAYQNFKPISQPIVPPRNWISSLSSNPFVSIVKELSFLSLFCFFGTLSSSWKNKDKGRREERGREYLLEKLF